MSEMISGTAYISMALILAASSFAFFRLFGRRDSEDTVLIVPFLMLAPAWPVSLLIMIIWLVGWSIAEQLDGRGI